MTEQICILLVAQKAVYSRLGELLAQTETTAAYQLSWVATEAAGLAAIAQQPPDICIFDGWLNLITQVSPAPIIVLTDTEQSGQAALQAGAADYLDRNKLSIATLKRSLRLILAHTPSNKSAEQQLKAAEERFVAIQCAAIGASSEELLQETITELSIALEELNVSLEELHEQNQELMLTRQAVEQERQHYQELFEFAPDGYLVTDEQGIIQEANSAVAILLNVRQVFLLGKPLTVFVAESDRQTFYQLLESQHQKQELWMQPRRREPFPAAIAVSAIYTQGQLVGWRWLIRDITEQKQAAAALLSLNTQLEQRVSERTAELQQTNARLVEEIQERRQAEAALKQQTEVLQTIFDQIPIMIDFYNTDGQIQLANRELERVIGWSLAELKTIDILAQCYPDPAEHQRALDNIRSATSQWQDFKTRVRDGRFLDISWANVRLSDGTTIGIGQDITERKQIEEALRHNEERLRLITDALPVCISYIDEQQRYRFANKNYERWFGYSQESIDGKHLQEVIGATAYETVQGYIEQALAGEPVTYEAEIPYLSGTRFIEANLVPHWQNERVKGYYALINDISVRKQTEAQLQYRLTLEKALAQVSKQLATMEKVDFQPILKQLGQDISASSIYLIQAKTIYQWGDRLIQNPVNLAGFPWWSQQLTSHNFVISHVEELPPAAQAERHWMQSQKINSLLAVVIQTETGQAWGQIGVTSSDENQKRWTEEDAQMLRVVGEMIYSKYSRIRAQEKLRDSEALYAGIFNHSAEIIFLLNVLPNGEFAYETINPAYEKVAGISRAEMVGKTQKELMPPQVAAQFHAYCHACLATGEPISYEVAFDCSPGKQTYWHTTLVPIRAATGEIVKLQGAARDITAEKQAVAEQLRLTRQQRLLASLTLKIRRTLGFEDILQTAVTEIQHLFEVERVVVFSLFPDGSGKVIKEAVTPGFPAMQDQIIIDLDCRDKCQEKYGDGYVHVFADVDSAGFSPCYLQLLKQHQVRANLALPIMARALSDRQNTSERVYELLFVQQCTRTRDWTTDEIELLQQIAFQLSIALEQALMREQEIRQSQELVRSNAELEQFGYIISHDLQEPLQTIANYAKLLERRYLDKLDAKANRYINYIVDGAKRMQMQIQDLLSYARVGRRQEPFELTNFNKMLAQALTNLQSSIDQAQATVMASELPILRADASQLVQLFQNLISNALKYSSSPLVQIQAEEQASHWLFSVSDNGIGIDPKYTNRIFEIFQRLHTQEEYPGTGIGLAICKKIVELHGGQIWVDSTPGGGATFRFTIPSR